MDAQHIPRVMLTRQLQKGTFEARNYLRTFQAVTQKSAFVRETYEWSNHLKHGSINMLISLLAEKLRSFR